MKSLPFLKTIQDIIKFTSPITVFSEEKVDKRKRDKPEVSLTCFWCHGVFSRRKKIEDERIKHGRAGPFCCNSCANSYRVTRLGVKSPNMFARDIKE